MKNQPGQIGCDGDANLNGLAKDSVRERFFEILALFLVAAMHADSDFSCVDLFDSVDDPF